MNAMGQVTDAIARYCELHNDRPRHILAHPDDVSEVAVSAGVSSYQLGQEPTAFTLFGCHVWVHPQVGSPFSVGGLDEIPAGAAPATLTREMILDAEGAS